DRDHLSKTVLFQGNLSLCEAVYSICFYVCPELFLDDAAQPRERTALEILHHFRLRRLQTAAAEFNVKLLRAERAAHERGQVVLVSAPVIMDAPYCWWSRFEARALGTPELPRKAIVEPELEVAEPNRNYHAPHGQSGEGVSRLPFVRVFSLDMKEYVYADVDDVTSYEFDDH